MADNAHSLLVNVLATPRGGLLAADQFRRYGSAIRTWATLGQRHDTRVTQVTYEVGRRHPTSGRSLAPPGADVPRIDASYDTNAVEAEFFAGLARRHSNFSGSFMRSSFAGVVERLALALGAHSIFGDVDSTAIRGNHALRVTALNAHDTPVTSLTNSVFIPRVTETQVTADVWAVLINAVAGEGASVVTDVLFLDANTNQAIVPTVPAANIAAPLVAALQLLGSNMVASGQGPLFATALTRGIHKAVSVVGHTDEGGITRDLLRCAAFAAPFGGINPNPVQYTGLPTLAATRAADIAAYVDSIALITAAAVAHADPGQRYNGEWFPQFFVAGHRDVPLRPGENEDAPAGAAATHRAAVVAAVSSFNELYVRALSAIFGVDGDHLQAAGFMSAAAHSLEAAPRHLNYASITPWFWVEPTSLLPTHLIGSEAESARSGALASVAGPTEYPAFDGLQAYGPGDFLRSAYRADVPSARRAAILLHFWGHPLDGISTIIPRQLDTENVVQPGPGAAGTQPQLRDRLEAGDSLAEYLWTRGQSPFPAPGELLNLSVTMGFMVKHVTLGADGHYNEEHMFSAGEFLGARISVQAARPTGFDVGASNQGPRDARRARTRATAALAAAKRRVQIFGTADTGDMPVVSAAPPREPVRALPQEQAVGAGAAGHAAAGPGAGGAPAPQGPPIPPTAEHRANAAPRPAQRPGQQPGAPIPPADGGAGGAIPPPPPAGPPPAPGAAAARTGRPALAPPAPGAAPPERAAPQ
ncbi:putative coat protein [Fusarium sambucinum victorivirus 1]|nr:putative coat protein [Fusarium sambucinum victorivirus 1]